MSSLKLAQFLPYRLSVAANAVSGRISQSYRKRFNLKVPEWRVIAILAEYDRVTPQDIGKYGELDKITVSRAARALLSRGLILQSSNPTDGRSHFLELTPEGRKLYRQIVPEARALEAELLTHFTPEEHALFHALLRRVEQAANSP